MKKVFCNILIMQDCQGYNKVKRNFQERLYQVIYDNNQVTVCIKRAERWHVTDHIFFLRYLIGNDTII